MRNNKSFGFDDFIYWHFFSVTGDHNISQTIFSRTLLPWPLKPLFIPLFVLLLTTTQKQLLLTISRHGHSWRRAPLGPVAIDLFSVKTFAFLFPSLFLPLLKGGVGLFLYRLVFTYHTLFHLSLHSFTSPQGLSRKCTHFTQHSQNTTQHLVLIYTEISVSAGPCSSLCLNLFNS
jgi:hypothetical protein